MLKGNIDAMLCVLPCYCPLSRTDKRRLWSMRFNLPGRLDLIFSICLYLIYFSLLCSLVYGIGAGMDGYLGFCWVSGLRFVS